MPISAAAVAVVAAAEVVAVGAAEVAVAIAEPLRTLYERKGQIKALIELIEPNVPKYFILWTIFDSFAAICTYFLALANPLVQYQVDTNFIDIL